VWGGILRYRRATVDGRKSATRSKSNFKIRFLFSFRKRRDAFLSQTRRAGTIITFFPLKEKSGFNRYFEIY
jgi:hypothetical protein